ncbi:MAG: hypothetical protein DRJ03_10570 [Chloroflexi bacterium]|nr:MAG: hypothetical protein DRI81_01295 [Chloroflexota bacterium]RLC85794.1 MAG: hypothetical protein DRJ03_10570 [Chloroflexota bacterium]
MSIQSSPRTIQGLFGAEKYYIDFYQRDYKWETEHVEMLLNDVFFRFETEYKPDVDPTREAISLYPWYYLSTFVTNSFSGRKFIVDGQQRLTTITLILIKLYHLAAAYEHTNDMKWLDRKICGFDDEGSTYWMGTNSRAKALEKLYSNDDQLDDGDLKNQELTIRNIYQNYQFISKYLAEQLNTPRRAKAFTLYFLTRVELVELHIDDSRDVAMVFEVINDRGEKLQPYEVFKGELLGQLTKQEVDNTYYDLWNSSINPLQDWDKREPDNFFRLLFRSQHTDSRQDYRDFDGEYQRVVFSNKWDQVLHLKRNPEGVKRFLKEGVAWYATLYLKLLELAQKGGLGNYVFFNANINRMERQHLLVLSAIHVDDPAHDEKIRLVSRLFDRHFTLLQLTGSYNSNGFTDSIIALNDGIRGASCDAIQAAFDAQLLEDISKARGITVKDPFQWNLFRNAGYELGARFIRYFFARLERFIGKEIDVTIDYYYNLVRNRGAKQGYHIEHILANNAENRALFNDDEDLFITERNRMGGLVLLKGRDNLASSNEPYAEKLKTYSHATPLAASLSPDFYHNNPDFNDFIAKYQLNFRSIETFDAEAVEERHQLYFELTKIIWGDDSFPLKQPA